MAIKDSLVDLAITTVGMRAPDRRQIADHHPVYVLKVWASEPTFAQGHRVQDDLPPIKSDDFT